MNRPVRLSCGHNFRSSQLLTQNASTILVLRCGKEFWLILTWQQSKQQAIRRYKNPSTLVMGFFNATSVWVAEFKNDFPAVGVPV